MGPQIPLDNTARAFDPEKDDIRDDGTHEIAQDIAYRRLAIANVIYYGYPEGRDQNWVLIDAGIPGSTGLILRAAEERFGADRPPAAIVMTHGHFDHVGALKNLAERWNVPIYAHELEAPYLNGMKSYLPPDPTVGGGLMSLLSPLYPRGPVDVSPWLKALPEDGSVPFMPGWKWLHTPGHTTGHVSLWRESDRTIIAGDAFITTRQESAYAAATQEPEMHGPPMYFTPDWTSARTSVELLASLEPEAAITGHGQGMRGAEMRAALHLLARNFDRIAVPAHGRYVHHTPDTGQTPERKH
jgi:glyoxylase-like metal-dependent hydrolase (beta-lactamase superfamily II)